MMASDVFELKASNFMHTLRATYVYTQEEIYFCYNGHRFSKKILK
jgi:hypothetical protein